MEDLLQTELDIAEEYILTKLFGNVNNIRLNAVPNWLFTQIAKGKKFEDFLNENIQKLEFISKGFMTETGYLDGNRITEIICNKVPILRGCVNLPTLKPIEYAKMLDEFINLEALGQLIKNL
jgi:hypothetical protein